jgi:hypothetical protein
MDSNKKLRLQIVESFLDGSLGRCKEEQKFDDPCTEPTYRFWIDPRNGKIWMPCVKHLGYYLFSTWKELK